MKQWKNPQSEDNSQNIGIQKNTKLKTVLFTFIRKAKLTTSDKMETQDKAKSNLKD